ncbi:MAG: CoB--CoM heterodisulfide reductase iron-sulfur subunit B family protein [Anaerolineae bacterium]|nr:CoB--CoM heterodisulfide reductase iron-sulfur subunit B family protein [Anaerolineae bacterium]
MSQSKDQYGLYPGCSLGATARAYMQSTEAVSKVLGLTLKEIEDWNCCGASEYVSVNSVAAYSLIARNLSLAAQEGLTDVVAPCNMCYLNLHKVDGYMSKYPKVNRQVNQALAAGGLYYNADSVHVRHLLDVVVEDIGCEAIAEKVTRPLKGLRVAPYYGCLLTRPESRYNAEYPTHLDELLQALGATVVDFPLKTQCCGGHMTQISEQTAYEMIRRILHGAAENEADAIVTICPMCQLNLDAFQPQVNHMFKTNFRLPILYFTQTMGLAFGLSNKELGIGSEITSAKAALRKIGQEEPEQPKPKKKRDKKALPMPPLS